MSLRLTKIPSGFILLNCIAIFLLFYIQMDYRNDKHDKVKCTNLSEKFHNMIRDLKKINNELSLKLKNSIQKLGQLNCEKNKNDVSPNGGWCSSISGRNSSQHLTDFKFAKALSEFLKSKRVASFGDGPGVYKETLDNLKQVLLYDAFDGAPFVEKTTDNRVQFLDLSQPVYHLNQYDWVISIEVAEHIPKEFEHVYVDNLVRHAKEGIILSWAREGQDGHSHINCRNFDYVKTVIEAKKFMHDKEASDYLKQNSDLFWIKDNVNVFRRIVD